MDYESGGDAAFVIDTTQLLLRRTASEESLSVMKDQGRRRIQRFRDCC